MAPHSPPAPPSDPSAAPLGSPERRSLLSQAHPLFDDAPHGIRLLPLHQTRRIVDELRQLEYREIETSRHFLAELCGPRGERVILGRALAFDPDSTAIVAFHRGWPCWNKFTGEAPLVINGKSGYE